MKIKNICLNILAVLIALIANLTVFFVTYQKLTFPFINEPQREINADYIVSHVLSGFLIAAILIVLVMCLLNKFKK